MRVCVSVQILRVEAREGTYLDKVSGQTKQYHSQRLYCVDESGYTGVFSWVASAPPPNQGEHCTLALRKFEDTSTGASGIAVEVLS